MLFSLSDALIICIAVTVIALAVMRLRQKKLCSLNEDKKTEIEQPLRTANTSLAKNNNSTEPIRSDDFLQVEQAFLVSKDLEFLFTDTESIQEPLAAGSAGQTPDISLRCWRSAMTWKLGIVVLSDDTTYQVSQMGSPLQTTSRSKHGFILSSLNDPILLQDSNGNMITETFAINGDQPIIFKILRSDITEGRWVRTISEGLYLVLAPKGWTRNTALSGPADISPEHTTVDREAHHFELDARNRTIAFDTSTGSTVKYQLPECSFDLVGQYVRDALSDVPLYIGDFPKLRHAQGNWKGVRKITLQQIKNGVPIERKNVIPGDEPSVRLSDGAMPSSFYRVRIHDENTLPGPINFTGL